MIKIRIILLVLFQIFKMKFYNKLFFFLFLLIISSCSSKKQIIYLQDKNSENISFDFEYNDYFIKIDDILHIKIDVEIPENVINYSNNSTNNTFNEGRESLMYKGYLVDSNGNINYPKLGLIKAAGLSILELRNIMQNKIENLEIFSNATINIRVLNMHFTVLGEVKNLVNFILTKTT